MLRTIGVTDRLAEPGCPILRIAVADGLEPGGLHFDAEDDEPLGWMHENRHLRAALQATAEAGKNTWLLWKSSVTSVDRGDHGVVVALDDGRKLHAPLLIAADGRNSATREAAGIRVARWRYDHQAIVSVLRHELAHENVAYEIFYPTGPFALLPMTDDAGGHRSAIVWSVHERDAAGWLSLNDDDFAAEAEAAMGGFLGKVAMLAPRSSYPLGFHHAAQITARRLALAGDAAHAIHPIAGQGLNLGFRDVAALAEVLVEGARLGLDLGDRQLLDRYQRWRSLDSLSVAFATDSSDAHLRSAGEDRLGDPPLRHGGGWTDLANPQSADERSTRDQRRASAAAEGLADLAHCSVGSISTPPFTAARWNCIS